MCDVCGVSVCVCVCMCVYAYACMCVCAYACMCVCAYACMCVCMYVCMRVCVYVCMRACVYVCICVCGSVVGGWLGRVSTILHLHASHIHLHSTSASFLLFVFPSVVSSAHHVLACLLCLSLLTLVRTCSIHGAVWASGSLCLHPIGMYHFERFSDQSQSGLVLV